MQPSFALFFVTAVAYLLGSLSFAVIVSRLMGLSDPRSYGSGNPGATNVLRSGNKAAAALTLLLDAFKGWLAVFVVARWGSAWQLGPDALALAGLAAFIGHLYPVFFKFKGGKGVATAAGVLLGWAWPVGLLVLGVWILTVAVLRYSSLAALVAAVAAAPCYLLGLVTGWWPVYQPVVLAAMVLSALLIWRHRGNIKRLLAGQEPRVGQKKAAP